MNCETIQSESVAERYVLGQLSDAEQGSFEEHFFECEPCFEQVRLLQGVQAAGEGIPRPAVILQLPRRKWMAWGAAAAVLLAAFGLVEMRRQKPTVSPAPVADSSPQLQTLAMVQAPVYTPTNLRSTTGDRDEKFRAAMQKYTDGDYAAAALALRGLVVGGPQTAAARFYLSIADLMTGTVEEPVTLLRSIDAMGETPYLEPSRFFLAKALLANKDVAGATRALEQTIALKGDREPEARQLLEKLRALPATR